MKHGQADQNRLQLTRIVEFATGVPGDFALQGDFRSFKTVGEYLANASRLRGRRALDLTIPPAWPDHGVYQVVGVKPDECQVTVQHKWTKQVAQVPFSSCPKFDSKEKLYIEFNWSESRGALASLDQPHALDAHPLASYFSQFPSKDGSPVIKKDSSPGKRMREKGPPTSLLVGALAASSRGSDSQTPSGSPKGDGLNLEGELGELMLAEAVGGVPPVPEGAATYDESALQPPAPQED
mmetsp:Transcript_991/g.2811  ORF Transcript_991/g.2811 Transcript_991/m.2811 type:complete len:238 (-) Transcript_991:146-859(-)